METTFPQERAIHYNPEHFKPHVATGETPEPTVIFYSGRKEFVLERGVDYEFDFEKGIVKFYIDRSRWPGTVMIRCTAGSFESSLEKHVKKKANQPNYRDILPKRARRW